MMNETTESSDTCEDDTERKKGLLGPKCPEENCPLSFVDNEEILSHLEWDHNLSELEARRLMMDVESDDVTVL